MPKSKTLTPEILPPATSIEDRRQDRRQIKIAVQWDAIERDYRAGVYTTKDLANTYGITPSGLLKHAKAKKWTKDLSTKVQERIKEKMVRAGISHPPTLSRTDTEAIEAAAERAVRVLLQHQKDLDQYGKVERGMLGELETMPARSKVVTRAGNEVEVHTIKDRSEVLRNLSQSATRRIEMERTAYSIEDRTKGTARIMIEID